MKRRLFAAALAASVLLSGCDELWEPGADYSARLAGESPEETEARLLSELREKRTEYACERYLKFLGEQGGLELLINSFPANEDIIFKGRPLSGYDRQELLEMAGAADKIGYRQEVCLSSTVYLSDGEAALPFGLERTMNAVDMYAAIGFSGEQAEAFADFRYLRIGRAGDKLDIEVKKSVYPPFSQHPEEELQFILRKDSVELKLCCLNGITSYTVSVYV